MDKFEPGRSYAVPHLDDREEVITVSSRNGKTVTIAGGRVARVLIGIAPDEGEEEVLRLDERGSVAGVVRVCQLRHPCLAKRQN